jgi:hypothetical protein
MIITTIIIMQEVLFRFILLQEFGCRVAFAIARKKQNRLFAEFKSLKMDIQNYFGIMFPPQRNITSSL